MASELEIFDAKAKDSPANTAAFSDKNHPLSKDNFNGAVEVVKGSDGKTSTKPLGVLEAGDHTVQLNDGRQFLMHIPPSDGSTPLPVMFVIAGSAQPQWEIKDFAKESGMNQYADKDDHKFIAVYPLPRKHLIGRYSKSAAWAWNAEGSLIHDKDLKFAGYDDMKFVKSVADLVPKLATVDSTHKDWGAIGWSQGAVFLNAIVSKEANLFPSIGIVGGSMQTNYHYSRLAGNAENVAIVNLLGDKLTLPSSGNFTYRKREFLERLLGHIGRADIVEKANPLAAIDNVHQDPKLLENFYKQSLFPKATHPSVSTHDLSTPAQSSHKDYVREYKSSAPDAAARSLTVFGLVDAKHSYPGPLRENARTNAQEKYTEFDASGEFVKLFNRYNDRVHSKKTP